MVDALREGGLLGRGLLSGSPLVTLMGEALNTVCPWTNVGDRTGNRKRNRRNCSDKQSEFWMVKGLENTSEEAWF